MMTTDEARDFRQAHDNFVKSISRKPKAQLADAYRQQLAARGVRLLGGGPASKDELVSAVVGEQFPLARLNESIHVLYHQDSDGWSACEHCHPHGGGTCDCALGKAALDLESQERDPFDPTTGIFDLDTGERVG